MIAFNLLYEPWIPLADGGETGLIGLFENFECKGLGGNPVEKIAILKLLLAIAQAATTEKLVDMAALSNLQFKSRVVEYLLKYEDRFYLYHPTQPFLQFPAVKCAQVATYMALAPHTNEPKTNSTVVSHSQIMTADDVTDAMLARLLVVQMNFAFGGKKIDKKCTLNGEVQTPSAPPGPSLLFYGALHSFVEAETLVETLRANLFSSEVFDSSKDKVSLLPIYPEGIGRAPWEKMPQTETCEIATAYKSSYMGRLLGLCRFMLIDRESKSIHYINGLQHPNYIDGVYDPTFTFISNSKRNKILWASSAKEPWRYLEQIFSFMQPNSRVYSLQVTQGLLSLRSKQRTKAKLILLGMEVGSSTGETIVSLSSDYVYHSFNINPMSIGFNWYKRFSGLMLEVDFCAKRLFSAINHYCDAINAKTNFREIQLNKANQFFWRKLEFVFTASLTQLSNNEELGFEEISTLKNLEDYVLKSTIEAYQSISPLSGRLLAMHILNEPHLKKNLEETEEAA